MNKEELLVSLCQEAIRIPSMSGHEKEVAGLLKKTMIDYGFDEVNIDKYGSVLGIIHGSRPGKTVLMDGHIDTVDVIDRDQWSHDPFAAEIEDGRIYGRGTSDMKGSVCAMITAAAQYAEDTGKDFAGNICVSCTVHEECFEGVSSREISRQAKPDFVIIGEATTTTVKIGQRGRAEVVVETEGKSCHSSNPEKGVNAVYHMMAVIEAIRGIKVNEHPILGKGILELTDIISSPYPGASVVPYICRATFDRRTLVGEDDESDGMEWELYPMPNSPIVRALAVESHYTIYTGGAEELGRWDRDQSGKLKYTSLNKLLPPKVLDNESFWRIWIDGSKVYFQTFRNIYVYDHQTMRQLTIPEGFLLLLKVRNEYWVQEMHGPLHQLKDGRLSKIEGSEFLNGTTTRVILPYGKDRYLIGRLRFVRNGRGLNRQPD